MGSLGQAKVFSLFFCKNFGKTRPFLVLGLIAAIHGAILAIKIVFVLCKEKIEMKNGFQKNVCNKNVC